MHDKDLDSRFGNDDRELLMFKNATLGADVWTKGSP